VIVKSRSFGISLLAVIGISTVFGIVLGGWIHTPRVAHAAGPAEPGVVQLAPAATRSAGIRDFADVVEESMAGVVGVTAQNDGSSDDGEAPSDDQRRELFEFFFGPDGMPRGQEPPEQRPRIGQGTGFIISDDGYILTNNHVVEDADRVKVSFSDGSEESARVVGTDPSIDLALLKVEKRGLKALPLGDSEQLRVGEWVIAIGNPLEFEQTVTVGVLSAKNRRVPLPSTDQQGLVTFLQTDAAINFGNSGGPLLDIDGNVVGINTAITRQNLAEGIGFALPIDQARRVVNQLRDFGQVRRGYIGIGMNTAGIDADSQEYFKLPDRFGVIIDSVRDDSPAADAGLRPFDVIRSVDGKKVMDNDDLIARISSFMPGDRVALDVYRDGEPIR
jgi:serine protease Do